MRADHIGLNKVSPLSFLPTWTLSLLDLFSCLPDFSVACAWSHPHHRSNHLRRVVSHTLMAQRMSRLQNAISILQVAAVLGSVLCVLVYFGVVPWCTRTASVSTAGALMPIGWLVAIFTLIPASRRLRVRWSNGGYHPHKPSDAFVALFLFATTVFLAANVVYYVIRGADEDSANAWAGALTGNSIANYFDGFSNEFVFGWRVSGDDDDEQITPMSVLLNRLTPEQLRRLRAAIISNMTNHGAQLHAASQPLAIAAPPGPCS